MSVVIKFFFPTKLSRYKRTSTELKTINEREKGVSSENRRRKRVKCWWSKSNQGIPFLLAKKIQGTKNMKGKITKFCL